MTMLTRLLPQSVRLRLIEALGGSAFGDSYDDDSQLVGFRRLTEPEKRRRDLSLTAHADMLRVSHWLYDGNLLGGWLVDQRVDLILGGKALGYSVRIDPKKAGLEPERASDVAAAAKAELDRFWAHPTHNLSYRAAEYFTTYMVTGHLILPITAVNEIRGTFQLDYIDAEALDGVETVEGSSLVLDAVRIRQASGQAKRMPVVRYDAQAERWVGDVGSVFYWRHSRILNATRGRSEFLRSADWIDGLDQFLWTRLDKATTQNSSILDVTLDGANGPACQKRAEEIRATGLKPNTVMVHNEKERQAWISPDLKGSDAAEEVRTFLRFVLGGKGIPESWFGSGGGTNRATAGEQNDVALKALESLQAEAVLVFRTLLEAAYDALQVRQSGAGYPARSTGAVEINLDLPPISERDVSRVGGVITNVQASLEAAVAAGQCSQETSRRVFLMVLQHLGATVDPEEEARKIEAEGEERDKDDAEKDSALALDRLSGQLQGDDEPERGGAPKPAEPAGRQDVEVSPDAVLNGAQVQAATEIVLAVAKGELPRDAGIGQLVVLFNLSTDQAEQIMGTVGRGFQVSQPSAPAPPTPPPSTPPPFVKAPAGKAPKVAPPAGEEA